VTFPYRLFFATIAAVSAILLAGSSMVSGEISTPGNVTVLYNGVLVQDHVTVRGRTTGSDDTDVCEDGPLMLQDHYHPDVKETFMQFRNIWIRPLL
jgi:hypothetical protein